MKTLILFASAVAVVGCGSDGSGTSVTCGTGTMLQDGMCISTGGGSNVTCGTGTHLDGTMCVPDDGSAAAAPTIATIDPPEAGVSGFVLFTITGTGFAGSNVNDLHVYFGPQVQDCEAQIGTVNATSISGEVPVACDLNVDVSVVTNVGQATIPFHYDAIFAADGDGGGQFGASGDIYLIDPFAQVWFDLGPIASATDDYGLSGMAFTSTGSLFVVTTGDSPGDVDGVSQLGQIDTATGELTIVGDAVDDSENGYYITDIKFDGTTLYGWGYYFTEADTIRTLVTIDTTTGAVTPIGTGETDAYNLISGSLAIDGTGNIIVSTDGAAADTDFVSTGDLLSINKTTGAKTVMTTLTYPIGAPIQTMAFFGDVLVGVADNGTYGAQLGAPIYGEQLVEIDPATGDVSPLFEMPAQIGAQAQVDAIAVPPVDFVLQRQMLPKLPKHAQWQHLGHGTPAAHPAPTAHATRHLNRVR